MALEEWSQLVEGEGASLIPPMFQDPARDGPDMVVRGGGDAAEAFPDSNPLADALFLDAVQALLVLLLHVPLGVIRLVFCLDPGKKKFGARKKTKEFEVVEEPREEKNKKE